MGDHGYARSTLKGVVMCRSREYLMIYFLAVGSFAVLFGCGSQAPDQPRTQGEEGQEQEEPKTAQITVWGKRYELFIEHRYIVAGTPTRFITHVTDMQTLEPRQRGTLTFVMQGPGGETQEHPCQNPDRTGIYIPSITFPKAGAWKVSLRIPPVEGPEVIEDIGTLTVYPSQAAADEAPEQEAPEGISFLKEQQWKILAGTEPVTKRRMIERIRLAGFVALKPGTKGVVTPPFSGRLEAPAGKPLPMLGDKVDAGQVIAVVHPPVAGSDLLAFHGNQVQIKALETEFAVKGAEIESNAIRERVAFEQAQAILVRVKKLFEEQAKSKRELEEAEFAVRAAQASMDAAAAMKKAYEDAKVRMSALPESSDPRKGYPPVELKAPISGTITEINAVLGEHVSADRALFVILDPSTVLVEARISEADLSRAASGLGAYFEVPGKKGEPIALTGEGAGRLLMAGQEIDPTTRTARLVYETRNKDDLLKIGLAVPVFLETAHAEEAVAIPASALVDEDGRPVVYVMLGGEAFEKRELTLGIRDGGMVQVLSGLEAGERVVTKGAYAVRLASVSTVIPAHGHAH